MRIVATLAAACVVLALVALYVVGSEGIGAADDGLAAGLFAGAAIFDLSAGFVTYFAPLWIAIFRGHPDARGIAALNLLLGWTVIGWLLAMVWAVSRVPLRRAAQPAPALRH